MGGMSFLFRIITATLISLFVGYSTLNAEEETRNEEVILHVIMPGLSADDVNKSSLGCKDCHTQTDAPSMHSNPAVNIGCSDCHGGDPTVRAQALTSDSQAYIEKKHSAHILPKDREFWRTSANPPNSHAKLNHESAEFIRFINPGDLRVAPETCGGCHAATVDAVKKSLMTTSAMLWGGASYNNGILPYKNYILGESYTRDSKPESVIDTSPLSDELRARGALEKLIPLPVWQVIPPGDIFRVFERGGIFIKTQFSEIGLPNPLEDSGRPDIRASNRGPGTGSRIAVPVINIHKTRLNDPHLSFLGTNDHPGDYRSSGCTGCHSVYANDRSERHSGPYAKFGHTGKSQTIDPTIPKDEEGHPLKHEFSRAIPTSQCMVCHMHQPNMFVNSYLGFTMWDYESDAPSMWPKKQRYPTAEEEHKSFSHNPEEAAARGLWTDREFLDKVSEMNPKLKTTQFADYHGHGWNFRAIFKRDRKGNLLDAKGALIGANDPEKFKKAVHLSDIHLDRGMHCTDCHFGQDSHGDGHIYGEVAQAVEIRCQDCHGTVKAVTNLRTSGPAAGKDGNDLSATRTAFGDKRFDWREGKLFQRSSVTPGLEWPVKQVTDIIDPASNHYNEKAARAKTVRRLTEEAPNSSWGDGPALKGDSNAEKKLAHGDDTMACFTCHSSWATSCAGCHLPIQANRKSESKHYEGGETRNWATYNPQVARDDMYQIGRHGDAKGNIIVPVRSSSALILSSTDINRQNIYIQQPPISAAGFSSQAFAPHFPHTVRTTETKQCTDCHISKKNDNNAILAQLFLFGTNFVNFMGHFAYVATAEKGYEAVQVTEWEEPQAVIGSYLHRYAYPDWFKQHQDRGSELQTSHHHHGAGGSTNTIQMRGEYLYTTAGNGGFRVYDIANISNKGFSERIVTAPVSPLGQDTHVASSNATSFVLPTNMPIAPGRKPLPENREQEMHPLYSYAVVTDSEEGLILVNIDTLTNGEPRDNFLERAVTWNEDRVLTGARHITLAGTVAYISVPDGIVAIDLSIPLEPKLIRKLEFNQPKASAIQFRYLFVLDSDGFHVVDVTRLDDMRRVKEASIPLEEARNIYLARTYAYIAGGKQGLVIIDIEKPEQAQIYQVFNDEGRINDLYDVKVATTNASLFAYLADGINGFKVVQLTDPERVPQFYGFSPEVKPLVIAHKHTEGPAVALSKALDRDRAVDESGNQVSVFGRIGSRPLNRSEMEKMYLRKNGSVFTVED